MAAHFHRQGWVAGDVDEAADAIWVLCGPDVYVALTIERGWSAERYESWLARMLDAALG